MRDKCIAAVSKAAGRQITQAESKQIEERINKALITLAKNDNDAYRKMSPDMKMNEAAKIAAEDLKQEAFKKRQRLILTVKAHDTIDNYIKEQKATHGMNGLQSLQRLMAFFSDGKSNTQSIETNSHVIYSDTISKMITAFEATDPKILGMMANKEGSRAFFYELFGEDSAKKFSPDVSKLAKEGAKEWQKQADILRERFNNGGGEIGYLENWRMPQTHNQSFVYKAGQDKWIGDIITSLDRSKYVNIDGSYMKDSELYKFLQGTWESIVTGGLNKADEKTGLSSMRAKRNAENRVLHFKDAESYIAYNDAYGNSNAYSTMNSHVRTMARDIGLIETFGPNPDAVASHFINKTVADETKANPGDTNAIRTLGSKTQRLYDFMAGKTLPVANEQIARGFDTLRNWLVATRLGTSFITSLSDNATMHLTAGFNHMDSVQLMRNQLAQLNFADAQGRRIAARAGLGLESFTGSMNRWAADAFTVEWSGKAANATMKLSLLQQATDARRRAFGTTMYGAIGSATKEHDSLADMPEWDRKILKSKGVTETNFAVWKKAELQDWGSGNDHMLTPDAIYSIPDADLKDLGSPAALRKEAAMKLLGHVLEETDMAVIVPKAKERAMMMAGLQKGNLRDEIFKSVFVFKGFPIATMSSHIGRGWNLPTGTGKAVYLSAYVAGMTICGAAVQQIYNLINGRDPENMKSGRFLAEAFMKGGALGIYGDYLFQTQGAFGNSFVGNLAGPLGGYVDDLYNLTVGNAQQAASGQKTDIGAETLRVIKNNIPLQNLWYTRAITDRLIFANLQEMISPGYLQRTQNRLQKNYGQSFYWPLNSATPTAVPNMQRAIGN